MPSGQFCPILARGFAWKDIVNVDELSLATNLGGRSSVWQVQWRRSHSEAAIEQVTAAPNLESSLLSPPGHTCFQTQHFWLCLRSGLISKTCFLLLPLLPPFPARSNTRAVLQVTGVGFIFSVLTSAQLKQNWLVPEFLWGLCWDVLCAWSVRYASLLQDVKPPYYAALWLTTVEKSQSRGWCCVGCVCAHKHMSMLIHTPGQQRLLRVRSHPSPRAMCALGMKGDRSLPSSEHWNQQLCFAISTVCYFSCLDPGSVQQLFIIEHFSWYLQGWAGTYVLPSPASPPPSSLEYSFAVVVRTFSEKLRNCVWLTVMPLFF